MSKQNPSRLARLDQYYDALQNPQRRYALYFLNNHRTTNVTELAKQLTAWETDRAPAELIEADYQQTRQQLYHKHLPRLDDYKLIEFDPRSGDIRFSNPPNTFMILLRLSQLIEGTP